MKMRWFAGAMVVGLAVGSAAWLDSVKTVKGTLPGKVTGMTAAKVDLETAGGAAKEVPVNQIQTIFYQDEPAELRTAKTHVLAGHYAEALAALERIKDEVSRPAIQQDIDFYKAFCAVGWHWAAAERSPTPAG